MMEMLKASMQGIAGVYSPRGTACATLSASQRG